jgi:Zn-dependent protease with chaperone function
VIRRSGRYFDGTSSRATEVALALYDDGTLTIAGDGISLRLARDAVRVSPRLGGTPRVLSLPDGGRCELADDDELDRALASGLGWRRHLDRLERHAPLALAAAVATVAALAATVWLGIPALAHVAARSLPADVDAQLGESTLAALDESLFSASALPAARREELGALFDALARQAEPGTRLVLRKGGRVGANAFALPGNVVILTDELAELAGDDAEIAAVLAHELGHVAERHALRSLLQNTGVVLLIAATLGDVTSISSLGATLPATLVQLQYSRRFEREADGYAVALLDDAGRDPEALASVLARLHEESPVGDIPSYLSTHPDPDERAVAIRRAANARR